jgi:hypothetical protein
MPDSVKLRGILDHTASWVRILEDGRIELEYYDYSPAAQDAFGNDVAWMYRIEAVHKPHLCALLNAHDDQTLLDAFIRTFGDVWRIKDWMKQNGIPFDEEFDSWA